MELNQLTKTMTELCGGIEPENIVAALTTSSEAETTKPIGRWG